MKNLIKNKAFTLVELIFVIGIIAILATVVVPRISAVKDNAKSAGVDSNLRIVQAYVQSVTENYDSSQADLLEEELSYTFEGENIVNPFSKYVGVKEISSVSDKNGSAVVYSTSDNTKTAVDSLLANKEKNANMVGVVYVAAYPSSNNSDYLEIAVIPYDNSGRPIASKTVIVTP